MSKTSTPESILIKGFKDLSLPLDSEKIKAFMNYLSELKKWNKTYNLTSLKRDEDIIIKHFLDSLLYLRALPEGRLVGQPSRLSEIGQPSGLSVMDVGSGAGFPGVPLKIIRPELRLYLVEPSRKKAGFLDYLVRTLKFEDVVVIEKRIEDVSGILVDVALTRALFDIKDFYKKASHLLRKDGRLILSKGPKVEEEIRQLKEGLRFETLKVRLPLTDIYRYIVIIYCTPGDKNISIDKKPEHSYKDRRGLSQKDANICFNLNCRLRRAGCHGFEGCPGFQAKT